MEILIAKANAGLIQSMIPTNKIEFRERTKNTVTFKISKPVFNKLINEIRANGYNEYALLYW